jgi:hypothetical protein
MANKFSKYSHWPVLLVFVVFVFGIAVVGLVESDDESSTYERRELAQFPKITSERVFDGDFTEDYVGYLQDQAPFRDGFRFLKSFVSRKLLLNAENNGVFIVDGTIYDRFQLIDEDRIARASGLIEEIAADVGSDHAFIAVLPTKGQALVGSKYLVADQMGIIERFDGLSGVSAIDLSGMADRVSSGAYYRTDPHWSLEGVLWSYGQISSSLDIEPSLDHEYELFTDSYLGSEYGKAAAGSIEADAIYLPRSAVIDGFAACRYTSLSDKVCVDSVYYRGSQSEQDAYDVFLGGLGPIIEITNPSADTDAELVIFKDSYAHAIAPLLAQHYSKVTMFDLRFVRRRVVVDNFDLSDSTVLFLYSSSVLNTDSQIVN